MLLHFLTKSTHHSTQPIRSLLLQEQADVTLREESLCSYGVWSIVGVAAVRLLQDMDHMRHHVILTLRSTLVTGRTLVVGDNLKELAEGNMGE